MHTVKTHIGMPLPVSINLDVDDARVLFATLSLVTQTFTIPEVNRIQAMLLKEAIGDALIP